MSQIYIFKNFIFYLFLIFLLNVSWFVILLIVLKILD